jgi:hypothetical protein
MLRVTANTHNSKLHHILPWNPWRMYKEDSVAWWWCDSENGWWRHHFCSLNLVVCFAMYRWPRLWDWERSLLMITGFHCTGPSQAYNKHKCLRMPMRQISDSDDLSSWLVIVVVFKLHWPNSTTTRSNDKALDAYHCLTLHHPLTLETTYFEFTAP